MDQDKIRINEQDICYYSSGDKGPAVVFVHGNSQSGLVFRRQLDSPLTDNFRLIALDLPGHGDSAVALDPKETYSAPGYARLLADFAEELDLQGAVYVGLSLGGHVVLEACETLPSPSGLLISGAPPLGIPPEFERAFLATMEECSVLFKDELTDEEITRTVALQTSKEDKKTSKAFEEYIRKTDSSARAYLGASLGGCEYTDEIDIVKGLTVPLAILHGEKDAIINGSYYDSIEMPTLWRKKVQIIADVGHTPQLEDAAEYNRLLTEFIEDVTK